MARRRRMGEVLEELPPDPTEDEGDWQVDAMGGDRARAARALRRGGWSKGERRGFGVASGRKKPPEP